jgi:hypothetical protein
MSIPPWVPIVGPILDRRRTHRELPKLAERWGLRHVESDTVYRFGSLDGAMQGHQVLVRPDVPSVSVRFVGAVGEFLLSTLDTGRKPPGYDLRHPRFEKRFRTMELSPRQATALRGRPDVFDRLLALFRHRVEGIHLSQEGLSCAMYTPFRFGFRNLPYLTAPDLERLLPEMIETVRLVESVLLPDPASSRRG